MNLITFKSKYKQNRWNTEAMSVVFSEDEGKAFDKLQYEDLAQGKIAEPALREAVRKVNTQISSFNIFYLFIL